MGKADKRVGDKVRERSQVQELWREGQGFPPQRARAKRWQNCCFLSVLRLPPSALSPPRQPSLIPSFSLLYFCVFVGVCVVCTVCCVEVRGQPVEWELVLTFHHVDASGRTQEAKLGSKHLL